MPLPDRPQLPHYTGGIAYGGKPAAPFPQRPPAPPPIAGGVRIIGGGFNFQDPETVDLVGGVSEWGALANDSIGDCVAAAMACWRQSSKTCC